MRKNIFTGAVFALFFLFWIYISAQVPYTHDDWDWGLAVGWEQWLTCSVNSRLAGNFFVVVMTRSPLVKTLLMGGCMFAVPLLLAALSGEEIPFLHRFFWANLLVLALPITIWRQTYGWVSGFANYGISCVLLLGWLLLTQRLDQREKASPLLPPFLFVYTLVSCLVLENVGALIFALSLFLMVWTLFCRRGRSGALSCLLGAGLGCFLLFYNPIYKELGNSGIALNGIRSLSFPAGSSLPEIVDAVLNRYVTVLLPEPFRLSAAFCLMMGALPLLLLRRGGHKKLLVLGLLPALCAGLLALPLNLPAWFLWAGSLLCWAAAVLAAAFSGPGGLRRAAVLLMGAGSVAPLAAITEMGERLFLLPFLLTAAVFLAAAAPALEKKPLLLVCLLALCVQMGWYIHTYHEVGRCSALRKELTAAAVEQGEKQVILPTEGHIVWWGRNPQSDWRAGYYRQFYGLPDDLTLVFLPAGSLERWPEISSVHWENRMEYPPS